MDQYFQNSRENYFFSEIFAIMPPTRQFGCQKRNLFWIKLGKGGTQNHLLTAMAKAAA